MKLVDTEKPDGTPLKRLKVTKKEAIFVARELLALAQGDGCNERGSESTHWVVAGDLNRGDEVHFCVKVK